MPKEQLTPAEVRQHANTSCFCAAFCEDEKCWVYSWVQSRGKLQTGAGDSGKDLIVMKEGGFPRVLVSGEPLTSGMIWSPSGNLFCFQTSTSLVRGSTKDLTTKTWLMLKPGESFIGSPVWIEEEEQPVVFGVKGGESKKDRIFMALPWWDSGETKQKRFGPLFEAQGGGTLMSWDCDYVEEYDKYRVVVVHRLANAMLAEIVMVEWPRCDPVEPSAPVELAIDCYVEYSKPQAKFLRTGSLLLRLNAMIWGDGTHVCSVELLEKLPPDQHGSVRHGLWLLRNAGRKDILEPVDVDIMGKFNVHGSYDVCSGSYGRIGASEGFVLDPGRTRAVVTARKYELISYTDELYFLDFETEQRMTTSKIVATGCDRGCNVPVAMSANELVFHFRSPTESGDLYRTALPTKENASLPTTTVRRLTETMSLSLKSKLVRPREVRICNEGSPDETRMHALLYVGDDDDKDENKNKPLQPLLWLHGGPMCQYSYDFNPLLSWLASCGYLVLAPNFSGSTGSGLDHMQRVLGAGCGVADLSDCLACAKWLKANSCEEPRLDLSRGIAVAGHSWGGYLALMCLLESDEKTGESVFSCGIASAGITDWFLQQRYTEVRYYDYALLGGWVYDPIVGARARKVSPQTRVAVDLRAPLLVLHGDQDQDVPFRQIPPFVEAAKQSPHPLASVEYHVYQGEGHGMSGSSEVQADYLNRIRTFLRIHLKPWDFTSNPHGDLTAY